MSTSSETEVNSIKILRELVKEDLTPYYDTDFNILRWVQGHNGNIQEAAKKLNIHLKTRKSYWNLDTLHTQPRSHPICKYIPNGVTGRSEVKDNLVVYVEQCGTADYHGMLQTYSIQEIMKANLRDMEGMLAECMKIEKETGKQAHVLYVMDLNGITYDKKLYDLLTGPLKSLSEFMQEHYVELMKFFVLVNVPSFVYALWTLVRPILPEKTIQKVKILSSSHWRDEILELAVPTSLPILWNTEKIDIFKAILYEPQEFPLENYYNSLNIKQPNNLEKYRILAGKFLIIEKELKKGDVLEWYMVGDANFSMGVFLGSEEKEIEKMDTIYPILGWMPGPTIVPLNDRITALEQGTYKIWLSNHRAWWRTLTLLGRFIVIPFGKLA